MHTDVISILLNKESRDQFTKMYFDQQIVSERQIDDFYSDYINSRLSLTEYIKQTTETY